METPTPTLVFCIVLMYITINAVLFKIVDDNTKYDREYSNKIFFIILLLAMFLMVYNAPLRKYRERYYLELEIKRYEWLKSELTSYSDPRFLKEYNTKLTILNRKLKLMKLYGQKLPQKSKHMGFAN